MPGGTLDNRHPPGGVGHPRSIDGTNGSRTELGTSAASGNVCPVLQRHIVNCALRAEANGTAEVAAGHSSQ